VTQAVLAAGSTPLLVLRAGPVPKGESLRVAVAIDGSRHSLAAVRYVLEHRALFGPAPSFILLHVAVAIDGSRHSLAAVRYVLEHRALFGPAPSFILLHVESGRTGDPSWDAAVNPAKRLFEKAGLAVETVRLTGEPAGEVIAKHLGRNRADLLVMGSHGRTPLKTLLLGSVATRVASQCRLPLLLVRPRARSTAAR